MEKYKELYILSKEVLNEERDRFNRIDEKASKYLTVLTFLIGVYGFFCNWIIKVLLPPSTMLEWSLLVVAVGVFFAVCSSWALIFKVLRQEVVIKIPLNDEVLKFFRGNRLVDIYFTLAKGNKDALRQNREITDRKAVILEHGYKAIAVTMCLVFVLSFLFGIYSWKQSTVNKDKKKGVVMLKDEDEDEPKTDIKPPTYDRITEGVDESKVRIKAKEKDK